MHHVESNQGLKTNHGEHRDHREKQEGLWGRLLFVIPSVPVLPVVRPFLKARENFNY